MSVDVCTVYCPIECCVLPLSEHSDLMIGDDWCNEVGFEISYQDQCLRCVDLDGRHHNLLIQPDQHGDLCPVVSAINLDTEME